MNQSFILSNLVRTSAVLFASAILVACNSGGSSDSNGAHDDVVNRSPVASDVSFITQVETVINEQLMATDADGDSLTYSLSVAANQGVVELATDGGFVYTPKLEFTGSDSFEYQVSDGVNAAVVARVMIEVEAQTVSFASYSREAFNQPETAMPLTINGREFTQDVTSEAEYEDLLGK